MRKPAKVILVLIFGIFLCLQFAAAADLPEASDFELLDLYQNKISLSSYRGKQPVLLFFWATWCPYCRNELKVLNNMYGGLTKDGLEVLAVNTGELHDTVAEFVQSYSLAYKVLLDEDASVANAYGIIGLPTYVLVDQEGEVAFQDNRFPYAEYKDLLPKNKKK